jgi:glutathione synthase
MLIACLISSASAVEPTWTLPHLVHAAAGAGHQLRLCEPHDLEVTAAGRVVARAWAVDGPSASPQELAQAIAERGLPRRYVSMDQVEQLWLRVNPLSQEVLQLALMLQQRGVAVINDPIGVARTRSKAWLATLADVPRPATLITASLASAQTFAERLGRPIVVKPAAASGGRGVVRVPARRPELLEEAMTVARAHSSGPVVVQEYLEEAVEGEKRLFCVDGLVLGAYLRKAGEGEFRHNLRQGGQPHRCEVTERDRELAHLLSPHLRNNGIRLAGLDVIGGRLVEVNTLNPGGIHWSDALGEAESGEIARRTIASLTRPLGESPV